MTDKETEEFQNGTLKVIAEVSDMLKRVQTPQKYIPCCELSEVLSKSLERLNIYYRYVQLDYIIQKALKEGEDNGT